MALGRQGERQADLMIGWAELPRSPGHAFYDRLQAVLVEACFAVRLHERTVGKVLRRLGFTRLSVRPEHPKADEAAQEAFKKASPSWYARRCPSTPAASRSRSGSWTRPASASRAP